MQYVVSARGGSASAAVSAPNWLAALGVGLDRLGDVGAIDRLACEVLMNGTVLARDARTGQGYVVRPVSGEEEGLAEDTELLELELEEEVEEALPAADEDEDDEPDEDDLEDVSGWLDVVELPSGAIAPISTQGATLSDAAVPEAPQGPFDDEPTQMMDETILEGALVSIDEALLSTILGAESADMACERALHALQTMVAAESGSVLVLQPDGGLRFAVVSGPASEALLGVVLPPETGIVGFCVRRITGLIVRNASADPRFYQEIDRQTGYRTRSLLCVPVHFRGSRVGCIQLLNAIDGGSFASHQLDLAQEVGEALAQRLLQERLR